MIHNLELQVTPTKLGVKVSEGDKWTEGVTVEHALDHFRKKYGELYGLDTEAKHYTIMHPLAECKD